MKRSIITVAIVTTLITGGSIVALNKSDDGAREVPATVETTTIPWPEQTPATQPTEEQPAQPSPETSPDPQTPPVNNECLDSKASALAPIQAKLDENTRLTLERTAWLTEQYNARKSIGKIPDWVTLEYYLDQDLSQTLKPVRSTIQSQFDDEASKFNC